MANADRDGGTFLGLDIGTSSIKALLIDAEQRILADISVPLSLSRPHPLWSEQNPDDWVGRRRGRGRRRSAAMRRRRSRASRASAFPARCMARPSSTRAGKPLRPAILWNDGRSFAECAELERRVPDFRRRAGNIAMPGFTAPKVLWVAAHEPEVFAKTTRILLPKDYVRLRLIGRSGLGNVGRLRHAVARHRAARVGTTNLLAATGLTARPYAAPRRRLGGLRLSFARDRQPPGAWRAGAFRSPAAPATMPPRRSASARSRRRRASFRSARRASFSRSPIASSACPSARCTPSATRCRGRWHGMAVMLSAASALSWIAGVLGRGDDIGGCVAEAEAFAKSPQAVAAAPVFLPYLSGERTPHNDAAATGLFAGLRAEHGADALIYAVMEGVAFAFADGVDVLSEAGRAADARDARRRRRALGLLGPDDRRRDRPDDRSCRPARKPARRSARRGSRMLAAGAGDEAAICARPPIAAPIRARRRARGSPRAAPAALSRALSRRRRRPGRAHSAPFSDSHA